MLFADLGPISDWLIKARVGALASGFIVNEINKRIAAASEHVGMWDMHLVTCLTMHYDLSAGKHVLPCIESMAKEMNTPG